MGYYTDYSITVENIRNEDEFILISHHLKERSGYEFEMSELPPLSDEETIIAEFRLQEAKFYEYKEVFMFLSKKYPHVLFDVYGEGEESGDVWKHRFFGGADERLQAKFTFPDFTLKLDKEDWI